MSLAGRTVSHYRIVEEISRGGMGIVYRATDTRLNRDVALKVLPAELTSDRERRERFVREARAASALEHPHIAVIHDIGEADGVSFIAMELVRGQNLSAAIAGGTFAQSPGRALEIAAEIAEGLARAHSQGIVHRDLKPANVMLTEDGHAKIIDFGLAKLLGRLSGDSDTVTAGATNPAVVLGTVAYMAPEQARGGQVDHRADIFAFGVLLYELFSGTLPFRGPGTLETMHAIIYEEPAPLRLRYMTISAAAADDLQRIVDKCLAKDPDSRYQGMKDLVVDLKAARRRLDSNTVAAAPAPPAASTKKTPGILIGVASLALVAAGLWLWYEQSREPIAEATGARPSVAVLHFENNTGNAAMDWLRTGLTDMLVTDLSQSPDVEVLSTDRLVQILGDLGKLEDRAISFETVQELARRAHVKHVLLGSYVKAGEAIRINVRLQDASSGRIITTDRVEAPNEAGLFPTMDDLTRRVKTQFASRSGNMLTGLLTSPKPAPAPTRDLDRDLKDVTTSSMEAYREYAAGVERHVRGRYGEAMPFFQRAVEIDPQFALAYAKMAVGAGNLQRSNDRDRYAQRALELVDRLTPRERYYIEGFYHSVRVEGLTRASDAYEKLLALYPDHAPSRHNVATIYLQTAQLDKAIAHLEVLRELGYNFAGSPGTLACTYATAGKTEQALEVMREYLARHPDAEGALSDLGWVTGTLDRVDESRAAFDKALAIRPTYVLPQVGLSILALRQDNFTESRRIAESLSKSPAAAVRVFGFLRLAYADLLEGRTKRAAQTLQKAVDDQGPDGSNESATARSLIAEILLAQGQRQAAAAEAERSMADARGRMALLDVLLIGSIAGSPAVRAEARRIADLLPNGYDKTLPEFADAVNAIEAGRYQDGLDLLGRVAPTVTPGPIIGPTRQPRTLVRYWTGRARLGLGDDAAAAREFTALVDSGAMRLQTPFEYVRSLYYLAQIAERAGDRARARDYYARFLKYWKDGDIDRDKVADALKKVG